MATWSGACGASADDAKQNGTAMSLTASMSVGNATNYLGVRFPNVTVPQGATINSATLTVDVPSTAVDTPAGVTWYGELATNAAAFTTTASDITNRAPTSATLVWSGSDIGAGDKALTVTSIVQEIVNQGGWASGNAMALLLYGVSSCAIQITSYDTSTTLCARLAIDYTEGGGGGGGITMHAMYYARVREG